MAKNKKTIEIGGEGAQMSAREQAGVFMNSQYIKDLSFENPLGPQGLEQLQERPKIDVSIDIKAESVGENRFEVVLLLAAKGISGGKSVFLVELTYGGLVTLQNIPPENLETILLVYCPSLLFPFARRVIADTTRDGGISPLMLNPIDFGALYAKRRSQQMKQAAN